MGWTAQYVLENEKGERYNLTAPADIYLVNVEGLGITTKRTFASIGSGFFGLIDDDIPQNPITGDLKYREGAYDNYHGFVNWIMAAKTLYFCYTPLETEYRCRVRLNYINKARRDSAGYMTAAISFHPLTPLYEPVPTEFALAEDSPYAKIYTYTYNDKLVYAHELRDDLQKLIPAAGHEPSAFLLRYYGAAVNPVIKLTGESGTVYGECRISETFSAGDALVLCTEPNNSYVQRVHNGQTIDLMAAGKVDLNYDMYPRAPVDEGSILSLEGDEPIRGAGNLTIYYYYRSV